jgi:hypothetical protein
LPERRASLVEVVDLSLRIRNRRIGTGPREADFERGKQDAIDDDRLLIRPPDPGVPQTLSGLEGLDLKAVIVHCHDSRFFSAGSFRQVLFGKFFSASSFWQVLFGKFFLERVFCGAEETMRPPKPM